MDAQVYYHPARRIGGKYQRVEDALAALGLSRDAVLEWAGRFDLGKGCLAIPKPGGWFVVRGAGRVFKLYDAVETRCTDLRTVEFLCETAKRMVAMAGNDVEIVILADLPNATLH